MTLILTLIFCLPLTVDGVSAGPHGPVARIESRCGYHHVPAASWMREGMTTAPWRVHSIRSIRERLPRGPEGDLDL